MNQNSNRHIAQAAIANIKEKIQELESFLETDVTIDDSHLPIIDRVKTFADIERISGIKITPREDETPDELAYRQVKLIAKVYNEGEVLDPMNTGQWKYFPWHKIDPTSGVGLSYRGYDTWHAHTDVGVRLCFKSSELATDAGKKFLEIYSQLKIK